MNAILKILFISRYGLLLFLEGQVRIADRIVSWTYSLLGLSNRIKLQARKFSDELCGNLNVIYAEVIICGSVGLYLLSIMHFVATLLGISFSVLSLLLLCVILPVLYMLFFLFSDERILFWKGEVDNYINIHGIGRIKVVTWSFILGSIAVFFLSLHIYSVFGNPAG